MIQSNRGMYKKEHIEGLGLPMFYDYECVNGDDEFRIDYWTVSEFKDLLHITLSEDEKKAQNLKGFKSGPGYRGWSGLYSMSEILNARGMDIKYKSSGDN